MFKSNSIITVYIRKNNREIPVANFTMLAKTELEILRRINKWISKNIDFALTTEGVVCLDYKKYKRERLGA